MFYEIVTNEKDTPILFKIDELTKACDAQVLAYRFDKSSFVKYD